MHNIVFDTLKDKDGYFYGSADGRSSVSHILSDDIKNRLSQGDGYETSFVIKVDTPSYVAIQELPKFLLYVFEYYSDCTDRFNIETNLNYSYTWNESGEDDVHSSFSCPMTLFMRRLSGRPVSDVIEAKLVNIPTDMTEDIITDGYVTGEVTITLVGRMME